MTVTHVDSIAGVFEDKIRRNVTIGVGNRSIWTFRKTLNTEGTRVHPTYYRRRVSFRSNFGPTTAQWDFSPVVGSVYRGGV